MPPVRLDHSHLGYSYYFRGVWEHAPPGVRDFCILLVFSSNTTHGDVSYTEKRAIAHACSHTHPTSAKGFICNL